MKINPRDNTIEMVRGDSETLNIRIEDETGLVPLVTGDTVYFTVKRDPRLLEKDFQITVTSFTDGVAIANINPQDTKSMDPGMYAYDVQVTFANGEVKTIVPEATFVLRGEVTFE